MYENELSDASLRFRQLSIEMADGVQLAADLYLPAAVTSAVPVLLELLPYRKDEGRAYRYGLYGYFVERGYAVLRVDIRGTGASDGRLPEYEYSEQEQDDATLVIEWAAAQSWCSGRVGMFGISWGGFNSIQLGMRAPEALGAIVAACASDDLFRDDVHYLDGMMHVATYEVSQDLTNALSAAPDFPLDEATLQQRFDAEPWMVAKLDHPQDGEFWQRGSLGADYSQLKVPALLLGGYYDGYRDSVPRMLEHVEVPVQALIGPWPHMFPHDAVPGPNVEWRERAVRWFDHFLKEQENGVLDEPALTYFLRDYHPPDPELATAPGRWLTSEAWPSADVEARTWTLEAGAELPMAGDDRLYSTGGDEDGAVSLPYLASAGLEAGSWWGDVVGDQAPFDESCVVFDSPPLEESIAILGLPAVRLRVSADVDTANWFVRLSDAAPDGAVTQVTGAGRSGAHRGGGEPRAIEVDKTFELALKLHFTSWVFEPGHRIRVAISNAQWPMTWPTPYRMTTTVHAGSSIALPVLDVERATPTAEPPSPAPDQPYPLPTMASAELPPDSGATSGPAWSREVDAATGEAVLRWQGGGTVEHPWGRMTSRATVRYRVRDADPAHASIGASTSRRYELGGGRVVEWRGEFLQRSDPDSFDYRYTRELRENGELVRTRRWEHRVPRGFH